jgi:DNA-binding IclR family transcriptional regulator
VKKKTKLEAGEGEARSSRGTATGTQTLERGLDLLELVARDPMRTTELVMRSGLSRSTAMRLVHCLVERGFLTLGSESQLRPGPTLLQLGACAQASSDLLTVARPHLETLSARTGLSTFLGRRDGDYSVHLHRTAGVQRVMVVTPVGTRRRLAETSLGKVLLLDEDEATRQRLLKQADPEAISRDWQESMREGEARGVILHEGPPPDSIRAIAAPVRDLTGRIVAAISVATVAQYIDKAGMEALAPEVIATAHAISGELGWQGARQG